MPCLTSCCSIAVYFVAGIQLLLRRTLVMTFQLLQEYCLSCMRRMQKRPKARQNKYFVWRKGYRGRSSTWRRLKSCLQGDDADILVASGGNQQWPIRCRQRQCYCDGPCEVCSHLRDCSVSFCGRDSWPGRTRNMSPGFRQQTCCPPKDIYCNDCGLRKEPRSLEQDWCDCIECTGPLDCDMCRVSDMHCTRCC
jgi:hypothetical protein